MKTVRIIKNWDSPNIFRQTPKGKGIWQDIRFTSESVDQCDYLIVLNYSPNKEKVFCPKENVWCIQQEPHNEFFAVRHRFTSKIYSKVFTTDPSLKGKRYIHSQGCLPWHVDKYYDDLVKNTRPIKVKKLSCITSSKTNFSGHKSRIIFIENLKKNIFFDPYGFGINPIKDKWNALAPYKYSLVLENFSGLDYWSEKITDCFLSWTMPIYYGCTNLDKYFPKESYVKIDINDPYVSEIIKETINSNLYNKNIEAIIYARRLVLEKYQFFPYFTEKIHEWESERGKNSFEKKEVIIPNENTLFINIILNIKRLPYYLMR